MIWRKPCTTKGSVWGKLSFRRK